MNDRPSPRVPLGTNPPIALAAMRREENETLRRQQPVATLDRATGVGIANQGIVSCAGSLGDQVKTTVLLPLAAIILEFEKAGCPNRSQCPRSPRSKWGARPSRPQRKTGRLRRARRPRSRASTMLRQEPGHRV